MEIQKVMKYVLINNYSDHLSCKSKQRRRSIWCCNCGEITSTLK
jgi:hypothetical protein